MDKPYSQRFDNENRPYVDGPSDGSLSYYGGTLWPESRFLSDADAVRAARIANIAFEQGYLQAQHDIRKTLGIGK